jgi:hypothetical protein
MSVKPNYKKSKKRHHSPQSYVIGSKFSRKRRVDRRGRTPPFGSSEVRGKQKSRNELKIGRLYSLSFFILLF